MALTPKLVERGYVGNKIVWPRDSWPLSRPSTKAWWRSDIRRMLTLDGNGKVQTWKDMVAGHLMQQPTEGSRPQYAPSSFVNTPGVQFGSGKFMEMGSSPWPINSLSSMMIVVCDQLEPAGNTTLQVLASYGNLWNQQRKVTRSVREGLNRGGFEIGNSWTTDLFEQSRVVFSGVHSVVTFLGDVSSTAALDEGVFSGTSSLALRTAAGRTRIGADSETTSPLQYCNAIIRDVLILDVALLNGSQDFRDFTDWANRRRVPW